MGVINKSKFFLGIFIPILAFLLMSHNTFAIIPKAVRTIPSMTIYKDSTSNPVTTLNSINGYQSTPIVQEGFSSNYLSYWKPTFNLNQSVSLSRTRKFLLSFEINAVFDDSTEFVFNCPQGDYSLGFQISECLIRDVENNVIAWEGEQKFVISGNQTVVQSQDNNFDSNGTRKTYFVDLIVYHDSDDLYSTTNIPLRGRFISFNSSNTSLHAAAWQIIFTQSLSFEDDPSDVIPYIEAQTIAINDNFQDLFDKLDELLDNQEDQQQAEQNAVSSIENQSPSDIQGSTSTQTTSIIGVLGSFVSALGNVQATSCNLTLAFPSFMGGSQTVNPCLGKDKAPTIVQAASSMLLIVFFVPLSIILLKMIYNEIRSWTSG